MKKSYTLFTEDLKIIREESYLGNLGLMELVKFYREATPEQKEKMNEITKFNDWEGFKKLIFEVLNIQLM